MAYDREAERQKMSANLKEKTGKDAAEWGVIAKASGVSKHGEIVAYLKAEHGLTHGYANMVANMLKDEAAPPSDEAAQLEALFKGAKAEMRPVYEKILDTIRALGSDIEVLPMKQYVSVRRSKQFACVKPASATRIDLGIKLKGVASGGRLEEGGFNGMVSHTVKVEGADEVDAELAQWLKQAYEGA
jgi:predicted transport protein